MKEILDFASFLSKKINVFNEKLAIKFCIEILERNDNFLEEFVSKINELSVNLGKCDMCNSFMLKKNLNICDKCHDGVEQKFDILCIAETFSDIISLSKTNFQAMYYVLEKDFFSRSIEDSEVIKKLINRITKYHVSEIVIVFDTTSFGQMNMFFLREIIAKHCANIKITTLSRGVPLGAHINYLDNTTLENALQNRKEVE